MNRLSCLSLWLVLLGGGAVSTAWAQTAPLSEVKSASDNATGPVQPGLNDRFLDPQLDVTEWVERFEGESREVFVARHAIVSEMAIRPGMQVADVGAGTGLFSRLFAQAVGPDGWIFAVEISPRFLEHIAAESKRSDVLNISPILGQDRAVQLPPNSIDVAFICDTYHHFEYPEETLKSIHRALRDGGILVVVDFERIPGKSREWTLNHVRAGKETFSDEIRQAGFGLVEQVNIEGLQENYFLRFRKR